MRKYFFAVSMFVWAILLPILTYGQSADPLANDEFSEDRVITLDLQDANLKDVLKMFSMQSGLNFIAAENVQNNRVTLYLDKVPVREAMNKFFQTNKLIYEFDENANIFIVKSAEEESDMITKIYRLKNRSVSTSNLEKQRMNLFEQSIYGSAANSNSTGSTAGIQISDVKEVIKQVLSKNGKLSEDNKTNSLIITDLPAKFPVIEQLIAKLDMPQIQVMLDVEMLDVKKSLIDKLGFSYDQSAGFSKLTLNGSRRIGLRDRGIQLKNTSSGGFSLDPALPDITLDLLKKDTSTKYLARPRLLTLNNETAEIGITKDEVVSVKRTRVTDENGNVDWEVTYERATELDLTPEGIGIFLRVTPMINPDTGVITMVVNPKSSSTQRNEEITDDYILDPEIRSTKSIVKVRDGETVVLGGLIHNEKEVSKTKIPVLGSVPILGMLFRSKDMPKDTERELLVFITPHIVKDQATNKLMPANKPVVTSGQLNNKVTLFTKHEAVNTALNNFEK